MIGCKDLEVAGEVESHPGVGEPGATVGVQLPAAAKAVPPIGQLVVAVHLWSLSELESGVKVHGRTLTLGFVLHT